MIQLPELSWPGWLRTVTFFYMLPHLITLHPNILTIFISFACRVCYLHIYFYKAWWQDFSGLLDEEEESHSLSEEPNQVVSQNQKVSQLGQSPLHRLQSPKYLNAHLTNCTSPRQCLKPSPLSNSQGFFCTLPRNTLCHKSTIMFTFNTSCFSQDMLCLFQCPSRSRGISDWDNKPMQACLPRTTKVEVEQQAKKVLHIK